MKAKKAEIARLSAEAIGADPTCIGLPGSPTKVVNVFPPTARGERSVLTGTLDEQIDQLVDKLLPYL
jgi:electron transfer flavoprotein beta subunit